MGYQRMGAYGAHIPNVEHSNKTYGRESLLFIRECCCGLGYTDEVGKLDKTGVDYNFVRDIDRLCLEKAISRFMETGSREDAFDVYYIYCELFHPFGTGYETTRVLLETLSEHEENSSSLLMKHRDHYSHSVYVFLLGLAIYKNVAPIRQAYNQRFDLDEGPEASCHFLKYWGLTSLFHDVGYPFEIAHQQIKTYSCKLMGLPKDQIFGCGDYAPFVSYRRMDTFASVGEGEDAVDLNQMLAQEVYDRFGAKYGMDLNHFTEALRNRAVHSDDTDYTYLDHAYFSGLILLKKYLTGQDTVDMATMDALVAILLHNSLFKFLIRGKQDKPLCLEDGQPLAYLLMLCDELQCWDRTSYGQNSRRDIFSFDFDMRFSPEGGMQWLYYYDQTFADKTLTAKSYTCLCSKNGTSSAFLNDIQKIVNLNARDGLATIPVDVDGLIVPKKKRTGHYASDTSYMNIYDFALALNGRYDDKLSFDINSPVDGIKTQEVLMRSFDRLSLEFQLSNIAQAKGFAHHLEHINCFYTDKQVDYEMVVEFTEQELSVLAGLEHTRWCDEKYAMGWSYGRDYLEEQDDERKTIARALSRRHKDMVDTSVLTKKDLDKDTEPMKMMLRLLKIFDGLTIYRMQ